MTKSIEDQIREHANAIGRLLDIQRAASGYQSPPIYTGEYKIITVSKPGAAVRVQTIVLTPAQREKLTVRRLPDPFPH